MMVKVVISRCNPNTGSITDIIFGDCKVKKIGPPPILNLSLHFLPLFVFPEIFLQEIER